MNHRLLDSKQDWPFYVFDCVVSPDCLARIHPLLDESAIELWQEFISPEMVSSMQLSASAWPTRLLSSGVSTEWRAAWDDDADMSFVGWIGTMLPWSSSTSVFFTWSLSQTIETTWEVFCLHWRNFLFDDEGPFLWSLQQPQAVRFLPSGFAHVGSRLPLVVPA